LATPEEIFLRHDPCGLPIRAAALTCMDCV